jgi:hypothetical protein
MHGGRDNAARAAAERYIAEGWRVVPVPHEAKAPVEKDWPNQTWTADQIDGNVGVILGPVSAGLCDVDLDAHWALPLAPYFLPPTATFGRASKPRSHWLYYCDGLRSQRFSFEREGKVELVELRGQNASNDRCGHQSVFPGSVHKSGESVDWDADGADVIARVNRGTLIWGVTRLAVACVIADGWTEGSQRNNKCRAWSAGLLSMGWAAEEVQHLFAAVFDVAGVEEEQRTNDAAAIERTIEAFERGDKLQGFGTLIRDGLVEPSVVRRVETLARTPAALQSEAKLARTQMGAELKERIVREAQNTDALEILQDDRALLFEPPTETPRGENFFGRELDSTVKPKPVDYICEALSIAPGNKITIVCGYSGTSKGPFLNQLALCVASGNQFLGKPVKRSKVTLFDFETGSTLLAQRLFRMRCALGIGELGDWLTVFCSSRRIDADWLKRFEDSLEPGMVCIFDSYSSAVGGNMNDSVYSDVAWALGQIAESKNATVIMAMHSRKSQPGRGSASLLELIAGHATLSAAAQSAIMMSRPKETQPHIISVKCGRALEEPFAGFEIQWADVPEPGQPCATVGEKLQHGKWGLIAKRLEHTPSAADKDEVKDFDATVVEAERNLLARLAREYAGLQASVTELVETGSSSTRPARRVALRQLLQRGVVLANYHFSTAQRSAKRLVWLPGPNAEIGIAQT